MAFKKGQSGNPAGRQPGSKNKIGAALRQRIENFLSDNFDRVIDDFESMEPADRQKFFLSLLPYCIGKKQDLSLDNQLGQLSDAQLDSILNTIESNETKNEDRIY